MCFPLHVLWFASRFGFGLSDANAKARAVIPILRKFTVARLLEPHCKLWTWADLGGLGRTGAVRRDSDLLGPICMSSEILEDFVDEV